MSIFPFKPSSGAGDADVWTADVQIKEYIETSGLNAMVRTDGAIIAREGYSQRMMNTLISMTQRRLAVDKVEIRAVSPIVFKQFKSTGLETKTNTVRAGIAKVENQSAEYVLAQATDQQASDIYLDIRRESGILSFRIYGNVIKAEEMDIEIAKTIARSLYSRTGRSQWVETEPCDTAFTFRHGSRRYRIRCNSVPDVRGSSLSCRIRDPDFVLPLAESGYSDHQANLIGRICNAPGGLILITGETNSGKSTTLASLMLTAPRGQRMIEIADPVEVEFDHCTHIELNHHREDAQAVFRNLLAATVRQNPDSLVLGEIRDEMTAAAAQNMAIQGKRVLSTLHTQSCVAAIPRLGSFGVDHHLLSLREFIAGIVNQNLVPVICRECGLARHPDPDRDRRYRTLFGPAVRFINPAGCPACAAGISGQTLVAQVYPLCLDRNRAHQLIADQKLFELDEYMQQEFGIESKEDHARAKAEAGLIDPAVTEAIIGEWSTPKRKGLVNA